MPALSFQNLPVMVRYSARTFMLMPDILSISINFHEFYTDCIKYKCKHETLFLIMLFVSNHEHFLVVHHSYIKLPWIE